MVSGPVWPGLRPGRSVSQIGVFGSARLRIRSSEALHPDRALLPKRRRSLGAKGEPEAQDGQLTLLGTTLRWFMKSSAAYSPKDALDHLDFLARVFWLPLDHAKDLAPRARHEKAPDPREGTSGKARSFPGQRSSAGL